MYRKPESNLLPVDSKLERTLRSLRKVNTKKLKESKQSRKSNHGR